jgi:dynein light intermediate chain 2
MQSREEAPKTTVALEYTYARAPVGLSTKRDVGSIYELGGGRRLANLLPVVITTENIPNLVIAISLDLSRPYNVLNSLLY